MSVSDADKPFINTVTGQPILQIPGSVVTVSVTVTSSSVPHCSVHLFCLHVINYIVLLIRPSDVSWKVLSFTVEFFVNFLLSFLP